jgi:hypothetical protein
MGPSRLWKDIAMPDHGSQVRDNRQKYNPETDEAYVAVRNLGLILLFTTTKLTSTFLLQRENREVE